MRVSLSEEILDFKIEVWFLSLEAIFNHQQLIMNLNHLQNYIDNIEIDELSFVL